MVDHVNEPRQKDIVDPDSRAKRRITAVTIGEDLNQILSSGHRIGSTLERFLSELAALAVMSSAAPGQNLTEVRGPRKEAALPSFTSVHADRRLGRVDQLLYEETEAIAAWLHHPYDPNTRRDLCGNCGGKASKGDIYCRQCGHRLGGDVDERLLLRRSCQRSGCGLEGVPVPVFVRTGHNLFIELHPSCTVCGEAL